MFTNLLVISLYWTFKYHDRMMHACSMLANVVMIYEEKHENDWRLDIKALLTAQGI
jgi:hypothetical protein